MTKHTRLALITSVWLLLAGAAETQAQHFLLESADRLKLHNVTAEPSTLQGKKGLQLTLPEEVRRRVNMLQSMTPEKRERSMTPEERARVRHGLPFLVGQLALVQEVEFSNGTIEVELAGAPEPAAGESAAASSASPFACKKTCRPTTRFTCALRTVALRIKNVAIIQCSTSRILNGRGSAFARGHQARTNRLSISSPDNGRRSGSRWTANGHGSMFTATNSRL